MSGIEDDGYSEEEEEEDEEVSGTDDLGTGAGDGTAPPPEPEPEPTPDYTGPGESEDEPPPPPSRPPRDRDDDDEPEPEPPADDFGPGTGGELPLPPPLPPIIEPPADEPVVIPPDPIFVPPVDTSKDRDVISTDAATVVLREAATNQYMKAAEELLRQKTEGEISEYQYKRKTDKLEAQHIKNIRRIDRRTAPKEWYEAAKGGVSGAKGALAEYAVSAASQVVAMQAAGEITVPQMQEMLGQIEEQNLANILGVDLGVLQGQPFQLSYTTFTTKTTETHRWFEQPLTRTWYERATGTGDDEEEKPPEWDVYKGWRKEHWFADVEDRPLLEDTAPIVTWDTERPFEAVGVEQRPTLDKSIADQAMEDLIENLSAGARKVIPYANQYVVFDTERLEETTAELKPPLPRSLADDPITNLFNIEAQTGVTIPVYDTTRMEEIFVKPVPKAVDEAADAAVKNIVEVFTGKVEEVKAAIELIPTEGGREPEPFILTTEDTEKPEEAVGIEEKPPAVDVSDIFLYQMEIPFREAGAAIRKSAAGLRAEAAMMEPGYAQAVYSTTGLAVRLMAAGFEDFTMPFRPVYMAETAQGVAALIQDEELRGEAMTQMLADPKGTLVDIAGGIIGGYAFAGAASRVSGWLRPQHQVARLDDLNINVRRTLMEIDDTPGGQVLRLPEADIAGRVSMRKVPKVVAEIMEVELADVLADLKTTVMGVEDVPRGTIIQKIDLPTSQIDELLTSKATWFERQKLRIMDRSEMTAKATGLTKVDDVYEFIPGQEARAGQIIDVEVIKAGGPDLLLEAKEMARKVDIETFPEKTMVPQSHLYEPIDMATSFQDEIADLSGRHWSFDEAALQRQNIRMDILADLNEMPELAEFRKHPRLNDFIEMEIDRRMVRHGLVKLEQPGQQVQFGGPWYDEGKVDILPTGRHQIDVKGRVAKLIETPVEDLGDVAEFIAPDPTVKKTSLTKTFPRATEPTVTPSPKPTDGGGMVEGLMEQIVKQEGGQPIVHIAEVDAAVLPISTLGFREARQRGRTTTRAALDFGVVDAPSVYVPLGEEFKRRTTDRRETAVVVAPRLQLDEDIIPRIDFGPKPIEDVRQTKITKPVTTPGITFDETQGLITIPGTVPIEIIEPVETVTPIEIPGQIQTPIDVPITIEDVTLVPPLPRRTYKPPPPPQIPRFFREEDNELAKMLRPDFGIKRLGRTVKIGTPRQALRGMFDPLKIFGPPKKKKKDEEEEDYLSMLFGK